MWLRVYLICISCLILLLLTSKLNMFFYTQPIFFLEAEFIPWRLLSTEVFFRSSYNCMLFYTIEIPRQAVGFSPLIYNGITTGAVQSAADTITDRNFFIFIIFLPFCIFSHYLICFLPFRQEYSGTRFPKKKQEYASLRFLFLLF